MPEEALPDVALDLQHDTDPAEDHGAARHIPHLGHAALFFSLEYMCVLLCGGVAVAALHITTPEEAAKHPLASVLAQVIADLITLAVAFRFFPMLWQRSFTNGISWVARGARRRWWLWVGIGFVASQIAVRAQHFFATPAEPEIVQLLGNPVSAWLLVIVGGVLFPLVEEIAFRGFLLPALAIAYDWLSLERTPAARSQWQRSTRHSTPALIFAALFSSLLFGLIHGHQLHWAKGPIVILICVSLLFSAVRVRTHSVAASTLMHVAYDGLLFAQLAWTTGGFHHLDKL